MTCCELHLAAELALWLESCRSGKQSDGGQRKGGVEFSFLFLFVLSLSLSASLLSSSSLSLLSSLSLVSSSSSLASSSSLLLLLLLVAVAAWSCCRCRCYLCSWDFLQTPENRQIGGFCKPQKASNRRCLRDFSRSRNKKTP